MRAHKGQLRKGSDVDYIAHPMEVLQILTAMDAEEELLVAGVLQLIGAHTEDKGRSWQERKETARPISLAELERLEDAVTDAFTAEWGRDLQDGTYPLFRGKNSYRELEMRNGRLFFHGEDYGADCEAISGGGDLEFYYDLSEADTLRLLQLLRGSLGVEPETKALFKQAFGGRDATLRLTEFCTENRLAYHVFIN